MIFQAWFQFSILLLFSTFLAGYFITFSTSIQLGRVLGWSLGILSVCGIYFATQTATPFAAMLMLILSMLFTIKGIVSLESVHAGKGRLAFINYVCFTIGWLGMRPYLFSALGNKALPGAGNYLLQGVKNILGGIVCLFLGRYLFQYAPIIATIFLMVGLSLIVHFGAIPMQAGFWRIFGVNAQLLFRDPYKSKSLGEFWSFRWNLAFSEMTSIALFRPLKPVLGPMSALWISFLLSGIFHEVAISLPVNRGIGLPTIFFLLQALGVSLEQSVWFNRLSVSRKRGWTFGWLLLPAPILFHIHFVKDIVWETLLK